MRNLKRYLAIVVAITMMFSLLVPIATAEETAGVLTQEQAAKVLHDLNLYKGLSETEFVPDLANTLNRQTAVVMLLRMNGVENDALDMTSEEVTEALSKFTDAKDIDTWAVKQVAYAVQNDVVKGFQTGTTFTFQPKGLLTTNQWSTLVLKQMGYEVAEFNQASMQFATTSKATPAEIASYGSASGVMNKGQLVLMAHKALGTAMSGTTTTLIEELINTGNVDKDAAVEAGFTVAPVAPTVAPTVAPVTTGIAVTTVTATNGTLTVKMDKVVDPAPVAADFSVVKKVYGMADASVVATVYSYDAATFTAVLNFAAVGAAVADQKVTFTVAYKTGTPVVSNEIMVAAGFALNTVNVINGTTKVALSGATNVNPVAPVELVFSGAIDNATVDSNSVIIANKVTGAQVPGTWAYDSINYSATFYPSSAMALSADYTFELKATAKSVDGTKAVTPVTYSFKTGNQVTVTSLTATTAITKDGGSSTSGGDGILSAAETVVIAFSDDVDTSTINNGSFKLYNMTQSKYVAGTITFPVAKSATFAVTSSQNLNDRFRVTVLGVKDLTGASLADYQREFVTGLAITPVLQAFQTNYTTPNVFPRIQSTTIQNQLSTQTYVQGFKLVYTFTANMLSSSFSANTVQIRESGTTVPVPANVSFDTNSNTLTVIPVNNLKDAQSYVVYFDINTIKTLSGFPITDPSSSFTTGDYSAPTVVSTEPAQNANNVIEDGKFKITFNEPLATANVRGGTTTSYTTTESVLLVDSSNVAKNISAKISFENLNKTIVIDATNLALARATTYSIKLNGGSSSSLKVTDNSVISGGPVPLASEYILSFTTRNADTSNPTVEKVLIGSDYATATVLATGTKDVDITTANAKNLYVVLSEKLDNTTAPILADNTADTTETGNVIVERKAYDATTWSQVAYSSANATVVKDLQISKSYITIPNVALNTTATAAYEYRVRVRPTANGGVVQDEAGNDLATEFTFGFTRIGTSMGWTPVAASPTWGTSRGALAAAMLAGATTGAGSTVVGQFGDVVAIQQNDGSYFFTTSATSTAAGTLTAAIAANDGAGAAEVSTAVVATVGDSVSILQTDGTYFKTTVDAVAGGAGTAITSLAADLTVGAANGAIINTTAAAGIAIIAIGDGLPSSGAGAAIGARVVNMTTRSTSISNLETSVVESLPVAFKIAGNAGAIADTSYINNTNVTIKKQSDGSVLPATVTTKTIGTNVYVSIKTISDLPKGGTYTLNIAGLKDTLGNAIKAATTTFSVVSAAPSALAIVSMTPAAGTVDVPVNSKIVVTFNADVTAGSGTLMRPGSFGTLSAAMASGATVVSTTLTATAGDSVRILLTDGTYHTTTVATVAGGAGTAIATITAALPSAAAIGNPIEVLVPVAVAYGATTPEGTNALDIATPNATTGTTVALKNLTTGVFMQGSMTLDIDGKVLTITPWGMMVADQNYEVQFGGGLTSNDKTGADTTLATSEATLLHSFSTEGDATVKPKLLSALYVDANSSDSVNAGDLLVLTFNTEMKVTSIPTTAGNKDALLTTTMGGNIDGADGTATWSADLKTCTITLGTAPVIVPNVMKITPAATVLSAGGSNAGTGTAFDTSAYDTTVSVTITK